MHSRTRFGQLDLVFGGGKTPVLNHVARLSVLYEDLRLERGALAAEIGKPETREHQYRVIYFLRRSLATLQEFQSGLTRLVSSPQYKQAVPSLSKLDEDAISTASRYFQANRMRIKELRNEVGGHVQHAAIEFATSKFSADNIGSVCWDSSISYTEAMCLELHYAGDLIAGAIASKLPKRNRHPLGDIRRTQSDN